MKTEVVSADSTQAIGRAVELLQRGEIVALPTETVYGLAADALQPEAVAKIFEAKERPRFDPLIVHLPDSSWLERVARVSTQNRSVVQKLANTFWPGPLTLVLPKTDLVPEIVTGGLQTVAVRVSAHAVFREIIQRLGRPVAAPSGNRFGRISPTSAQHVLQELGGRISLIIDAGPTQHGLESTVIIIRHDRVELLRPGPITPEQLRGIGCQPMGQWPADDAAMVESPGQLPSHYAPRTPIILIKRADAYQCESNQRVGLLAWKRPKHCDRFAMTRQLSSVNDLREAGVNLFRYLRELDEANLDLIVAELVPEEGLGIAINDRLRRAAGG